MRSMQLQVFSFFIFWISGCSALSTIHCAIGKNIRGTLHVSRPARYREPRNAVLVDNWRAQNVYTCVGVVTPKATYVCVCGGSEAARYSFRRRLTIAFGNGACAPSRSPTILLCAPRVFLNPESYWWQDQWEQLALVRLGNYQKRRV